SASLMSGVWLIDCTSLPPKIRPCSKLRGASTCVLDLPANRIVHRSPNPREERVSDGDEEASGRWLAPCGQGVSGDADPLAAQGAGTPAASEPAPRDRRPA